VNVTGQASDLLTGLMAQPWGQVTDYWGAL